MLNEKHRRTLGLLLMLVAACFFIGVTILRFERVRYVDAAPVLPSAQGSTPIAKVTVHEMGQQVANAHLFGKEQVQIATSLPANAEKLPSPMVTQYKLIGILLGPQARPKAAIQVATELNSQLYTVGDKLPGEAVISQIVLDSVTLTFPDKHTEKLVILSNSE